MNVIRAITDPNLFRPFLGADLTSWSAWTTALRVLYGLPIKARERPLIEACTGRDGTFLPRAGFTEALFLVGRRSGKSRVSAIIGAYEAALAGHERKLSRGERGVVAVCAPTRPQARVVMDYIKALFEAPLLAAEVAEIGREHLELNSGTLLTVMAGHFRTVRGFTLLAAIVDEVAFLGLDEESKVRSDTELIRSLRPGLATVQGRLISITSPYARKGYTWQTHQKHHGSESSRVLVWNCPSRVMNPTLSQAVVDAALEEDLQAAKAEYLGEFRDDVAAFIPRELVEACVVKDRIELWPDPAHRYVAFVDPSGGRTDDAALAVGHREGRRVVVDLLKRYRAPHDPFAVVRQMARELDRFGLTRATGDNYSAEFVARAFQAGGVRYVKCAKPKAELYRELLPRLTSGLIELPDDGDLVAQIAGLERRVRSGGKDVIDHPPGGHDDLANVVAGVADESTDRRVKAGVLGGLRGRTDNPWADHGGE